MSVIDYSYISLQHKVNEPQNDMVIKRAIFYASIPQKDIWVLQFNLLLIRKYTKQKMIIKDRIKSYFPFSANIKYYKIIRLILLFY